VDGRDVYSGRLVGLLSPAVPLGELTAPTPETETALGELTRLLDAVAHG
jgi:hypothetical protein